MMDNTRVTTVGLMQKRLPANARPRLMRLAQRGVEVCSKYKAPLLAQICDALGLALADLATAERRVEQAEKALAKERARAADLEQELARRARLEFEESTVTRQTNPMLILASKPDPR